MMPSGFWQPPPPNIVLIVLTICVIVAYIWGYWNYKKALKCKRQLDLLRHHFEEPNTILPNNQTSPRDNMTMSNQPKDGDVR
ncbi:hypothetical protein ACFLVS_02220 [Chloroflexota bacterium]